MSGGGMGVGSSSNYEMKANVGELAGNSADSSNYSLGPGLMFTQQANVPGAPTFTNPANYYNRLHFVLNTGGNPSDTLFVIAISSDNFVTTQYIQLDNTIGSSPVYQTYTNWGGGTGADVLGLNANTTYKIKVKAIHTKYNETQFSQEATASTIAVSLTYDLDISATDSESSAPYTINFGTLTAGSVTTASEKIWVDLNTNAQGGAFVYLYANGTGLTSTAASYTIPSATANLSAVSEGYGVQISSVAQSADGPLTKVSPYDSTSENVGVIDATTRNILTTGGGPITAGRASLFVKAKASTTTPAANDFTSIITMIASGTF